MQLHNPKFGNTWRINTKVVTEHASGGPLLQLRDADWPKIEAFDMTFENMSKAEKDALESFLINTAGQEIDITDLEGRAWKGIFTSDPIEFRVTGRGCRWTVTLSFEGFIVDFGV